MRLVALRVDREIKQSSSHTAGNRRKWETAGLGWAILMGGDDRMNRWLAIVSAMESTVMMMMMMMMRVKIIVRGDE